MACSVSRRASCSRSAAALAMRLSMSRRSPPSLPCSASSWPCRSRAAPAALRAAASASGSTSSVPAVRSRSATRVVTTACSECHARARRAISSRTSSSRTADRAACSVGNPAPCSARAACVSAAASSSAAVAAAASATASVVDSASCSLRAACSARAASSRASASCWIRAVTRRRSFSGSPEGTVRRISASTVASSALAVLPSSWARSRSRPAICACCWAMASRW